MYRASSDGDDKYNLELADSVPSWRLKNGNPGPIGACVNRAVETLGDATDLWGGTWTVSHINSNSFQVRLTQVKSGKQGTTYVDYIEVTVYYTTVTETITAKNFPMSYLAKPLKAQQLTSKVEGATITKVANDFPEELIKSGKAKELKSKWS